MYSTSAGVGVASSSGCQPVAMIIGSSIPCLWCDQAIKAPVDAGRPGGVPASAHKGFTLNDRKILSDQRGIC